MIVGFCCFKLYYNSIILQNIAIRNILTPLWVVKGYGNAYVGVIVYANSQGQSHKYHFEQEQ